MRSRPAAISPDGSASASTRGSPPDHPGSSSAVGPSGPGARAARTGRRTRDRHRPPIFSTTRSTTRDSCTCGAVSLSRAGSCGRGPEVAVASDLPIWRALATCLLGAATSALGRPEEGTPPDRRRPRSLRRPSTPPVFWPLIRFMQAQAYVEAGAPEPGFPLIDEAPSWAARTMRRRRSSGSSEATSRCSAWSPKPGPPRSPTRRLRDSDALRRSDAAAPAAARLARMAPDAERAGRIEALRAVHTTFTEGQSTPDLPAGRAPRLADRVTPQLPAPQATDRRRLAAARSA